MAKSVNELDLKDEKLPTQSYDDLPEFGSYTPPPQPGAYRFQLPSLDKVWETVDSQNGQRVRAVFDASAPLTIVSPASAKGESFQTRISNVERKRGKDGPTVSDLDFLLRALGEKQRPAGNRAYIETLKKYAGKEFGADLTYSFRCSKDRNIRVFDESGKLQEVQGQAGCGKGYYQRDLQRDAAGNFPHELACECGAVLRVFSNLENFRA